MEPLALTEAFDTSSQARRGYGIIKSLHVELVLLPAPFQVALCLYN